MPEMRLTVRPAILFQIIKLTSSQKHRQVIWGTLAAEYPAQIFVSGHHVFLYTIFYPVRLVDRVL